MYLHIHMPAALAWIHAGLVEENLYPTSQQTIKRLVVPKQSLTLKQTCGRIKTTTPTQRPKTIPILKRHTPTHPHAQIY